MAASPFLQVNAQGNFERFGKRVRGFMFNWYGLLQSNFTLDQYRTIMKAAAQWGILGFRCWAMNSQGLNASDSAGSFVYLNAAGPNLVPNPSFESNSNGWQLGTGYSRVSEGWQTGDTAHNSSYAIKAAHASGFENLIINDDGVGIAVEQNTDYVFWVYARVAITSGLGPIIEVNRNSAYGTQLGTTAPLTSTYASAYGKHQFRKVGFTFNSGSATKVWIRCYNNNGNVTVYYDDFHISKLGGSLAFREPQWQAFDRALVAARENGLILKPSFMDNWGGQKGFLVNCADRIHGINGMTGGDQAANGDGVEPEFVTRTQVKNLYKQIVDFAAARVNSVDGLPYVQDWALWPEVGNELRHKHTNGSTNQNTITAQNFIEFGKAGGWLDEMVQYWQTKFPNHIIESTDLAHSYQWFQNDPFYNGSFDYAVDHQVTGAITSIKSVSGHIYPSEDEPDYRLKAYYQKLSNNSAAGRTEENFFGQVYDAVNTAKTVNGKPFTWDEIGVDKRATTQSGGYFYPRWDFFRRFATYFFLIGGDIISIWHGSTALFDDPAPGNYNFLIDGTLHTGGSAAGNDNDDGTKMMQLIRDITRSLNAQKKQITPRQI